MPRLSAATRAVAPAFGQVRRQAPRLVARQPIGRRAVRRSDMSEIGGEARRERPCCCRSADKRDELAPPRSRGAASALLTTAASSRPHSTAWRLATNAPMHTILCGGCFGNPNPRALRTSASVASPISSILVAAARSGTPNDDKLLGHDLISFLDERWWLSLRISN